MKWWSVTAFDNSDTVPASNEYTAELDRAFQAFVKGKQDVAIHLCEKAQRLEPGKHEHLFIFGLISMSFNETDVAIRFMEERHDLAPDCREFADALSKLYSKARKQSESFYFSKLALGLDSCPLLAGYALNEFGDYKKNIEQVGFSTSFNLDFMMGLTDLFYPVAEAEIERTAEFFFTRDLCLTS